MHSHVLIHMKIDIQALKCINTHTQTCVHSLMCTHIHLYSHTHTYAHRRVYIHTCICTHICTTDHMYSHTCKQDINAHTDMHAYALTYTQK